MRRWRAIVLAIIILLPACVSPQTAQVPATEATGQATVGVAGPDAASEQRPGWVTYAFSVTVEGEGDIPRDAYIIHSLSARTPGAERANIEFGLMCGRSKELPTEEAPPCEVGATYRKSISVPVGATIEYSIDRHTYRNIDGVLCQSYEQIVSGSEVATKSKTFTKSVVHEPAIGARAPGQEEMAKYTVELELVGEAPKGDGFQVSYGAICRHGDACPAWAGMHTFCGPSPEPAIESKEPCESGGTVYTFERDDALVCGLAEHDIIRVTRSGAWEKFRTVKDIVTGDTTRRATYRYEAADE